MIYTYRFVKKKANERKQRQAAAAAQTNDDAPVAATSPQRQDAQESASTVQETSGEEAPKDHSTLKWNLMLLAALALPVFFETVDYTVVATAQVHIASLFDRLDLQSYIGTVYLLTSTVFLPPFASVADIFGRHWALQLALLFFMIGSAISTGSNDMPTMLVGRGIAGIGAAGLLAVVRIILTDSGSLDQNNWQQGILFVLYTFGYCIGPVIGGALVTVSFRWIFAINLPCSAVAMVLAFLILRGRTKGSQPSHRLPTDASTLPAKDGFIDKLLRIDWIGAALFMVGGILLLLALNWGSNEVWNQTKVIVCFVVGGVSIIAFTLWEYYLERQELSPNSSSFRLRATDPMIPLEVFKSFDICITMFGTFVNGMVMLVMFYFVAIFFVIVTGLSPTKSGVQLIYFAPGMGGGSLISMQVIRHTRQPKYCIMLGSLVSAVALGLISMGMDQNKESLVNGFMAMAGVGTGLSIAPLAVQARFAQPAERNAVISALMLFFRSFGGTVGLAQCGAVLNGKVTSNIAHLISTGAVSPADADAIARASSAGLDSSAGIGALPDAAQTLVRDAFRSGTRWAFLSLVPWCAVAFLLSLMLKKIDASGRQRKTGEGEKAGSQDTGKDVVNVSPKV